MSMTTTQRQARADLRKARGIPPRHINTSNDNITIHDDVTIKDNNSTPFTKTELVKEKVTTPFGEAYKFRIVKPKGENK